MTQQNRPPRAALKKAPLVIPPPMKSPVPGTLVQLTTDADLGTGVVVSSDEWMDSFLLRGVDISDQTLVEWMVGNQPVRRWERTSQLFVQPNPVQPEQQDGDQ